MLLMKGKCITQPLQIFKLKDVFENIWEYLNECVFYFYVYRITYFIVFILASLKK